MSELLLFILFRRIDYLDYIIQIVKNHNKHIQQYVRMVITYNKGKDQPGKAANPTRGQLKRENEYSPVPVRA